MNYLCTLKKQMIKNLFYIILIFSNISCFNDAKIDCTLKFKPIFVNYRQNSFNGFGLIKTNQNPNCLTQLSNENYCPYVIDTITQIFYIHRDFISRSNICNDTIWFPIN